MQTHDSSYTKEKLVYFRSIIIVHIHVLPSLDALKRMLNLNQPLPRAVVATEPVWKVSRIKVP